MKKFFSMLALASLSLSSFAQDATTQEKYSVATNSFWSNWFYEVGADWNSWYSAQEKGAGYSKSPFKKFRSNPGVSLAFGKWYTPGVGSVPRFRASGVSMWMLMAMMLPTRATVISTGLPMSR